MRVLVLGGTGMLGHKLVQRLGRRFEVWATIRGRFDDVARFGIFDRTRTISGIDVENLEAMREALGRVEPDVVINAIGIIKQHPNYRNAAKLANVNERFPHELAQIVSEKSARLISISTDCVFSGDRGNYCEADPPDPVDDYGRSKLAGEISAPLCLTIRTSMIGRELSTRTSLVEWFLANRGGRVNGYANAIYTGFPTIVLSELMAEIIVHQPALEGLYHVSSDPISKLELLRLLNKHFRAGVTIEPAYEPVIDRSLDSSLFRRSTGFLPMDWDRMICEMAQDPTPYDDWQR